ncbi:EAL domain-containing protein [Aliivibrio sp. S3TY1]|uniref:EAL domain-containing protein n=1 Tax=unclassified Aliivibrio TaxID=2645654 RepID=UPI003FCE7FEF
MDFIRKNKRISFTLDDFGKEYSNIDRLLTLPIDIVKIDKSITCNLENDKLRYNLLINTCRNVSSIFKKEIVIEGIENEKQIELINSIGEYCHQGYIYGYPCNLSEIIF